MSPGPAQAQTSTAAGPAVPGAAPGTPAAQMPQPDLQQALALRDIHPPGPPPAWPPAAGWWVLLALTAAGLAALSLRGWRAWRARVRRRRILEELAGIGARAQGAALAAEVSALLKRVALARFDRREVAALTGSHWLAFLDHHGGRGRFAAGPGRVLAEGPYAPAPELEPQALLDLARDWIGRNA